MGISEVRLAHGWACQGSKRLSETCRPEVSTPRWVACKTAVALFKYTYIDVRSLSFFKSLRVARLPFVSFQKKGKFLRVWSRARV